MAFIRVVNKLSKLPLPANLPPFSSDGWTRDSSYNDGWVSDRSSIPTYVGMGVESYGYKQGYLTSPTWKIGGAKSATVNLSIKADGDDEGWGYVEFTEVYYGSTDGVNFTRINTYTTRKDTHWDRGWWSFTRTVDLRGYKFFRVQCSIFAYMAGGSAHEWGQVQYNSITFS